MSASSLVILAPGDVSPGHMMLAPLSTNRIAPLSTCMWGKMNGTEIESQSMIIEWKKKDEEILVNANWDIIAYPDQYWPWMTYLCVVNSLIPVTQCWPWMTYLCVVNSLIPVTQCWPWMAYLCVVKSLIPVTQCWPWMANLCVVNSLIPVTQCWPWMVYLCVVNSLRPVTQCCYVLLVFCPINWNLQCLVYKNSSKDKSLTNNT